MKIMDLNYKISITPLAMQQILSEIKAMHAQRPKEEFGIVISDTHVSGCIYDVKVYSVDELKDIGHYVLVFPPEYHQHGFAIYVDRQILHEHYLHEEFILDYITTSTGTKRYEIKNPAFEK